MGAYALEEFFERPELHPTTVEETCSLNEITKYGTAKNTFESKAYDRGLASGDEKKAIIDEFKADLIHYCMGKKNKKQRKAKLEEVHDRLLNEGLDVFDTRISGAENVRDKIIRKQNKRIKKAQEILDWAALSNSTDSASVSEVELAKQKIANAESRIKEAHDAYWATEYQINKDKAAYKARVGYDDKKLLLD